MKRTTIGYKFIKSNLEIFNSKSHYYLANKYVHHKGKEDHYNNGLCFYKNALDSLENIYGSHGDDFIWVEIKAKNFKVNDEPCITGSIDKKINLAKEIKINKIIQNTELILGKFVLLCTEHFVSKYQNEFIKPYFYDIIKKLEFSATEHFKNQSSILGIDELNIMIKNMFDNTEFTKKTYVEGSKEAHGSRYYSYNYDSNIIALNTAISTIVGMCNNCSTEMLVNNVRNVAWESRRAVCLQTPMYAIPLDTEDQIASKKEYQFQKNALQMLIKKYSTKIRKV